MVGTKEEASIMRRSGTTRAVSIDDFVDRLGFGTYQWRLLVISGLAWASDAGETMILSFLGPAVKCAFTASSTAQSALSTVVFIGMAFGTLAFGRLADILGRKRSVLVSACMTVAFGLASAGAPSTEWLILFRMLTGFGIGGVPLVFTQFVEIVPKRRRGMWASIIQTWWSVGTMAVTGIAWWLLQDPGWRVVVALAAIPLLVLTVVYALVVFESPRHLYEHGRVAEAEAVLRRIARINGVEEAVRDIHLSAPARAADRETGAKSPLLTGGAAAGEDRGEGEAASRGSSAYGSLDEDAAGAAEAGHTTAPCGPDGVAAPMAAVAAAPAPSGVVAGCCASLRSGVGGTVAILGELVGPGLALTSTMVWLLWLANAFGYYGIVLLTTEVRVASADSPCAGGQVSLTNEDFSGIFIDSAAEVPGLIMAALLVDVIGRRRSQVLALVMTALACAALMLIPEGQRGAETAALFVARAFVLMSFTVVWVFTPEAYSQRLRTTGIAVANTFGRIGAGVAPFIGHGLVAGGRLTVAEGAFTGVALLGALFAYLIPIETAGRELGASSAAAGQRSAAGQAAVGSVDEAGQGEGAAATASDDGISLAPLEEAPGLE